MERQRFEFVNKVKEEGYSKAEACRIHGISRVTGDKWIKRYEKEKLRGLVDRSRRPKKLREPTSFDVLCKIMKVRNDHPHWGGRTIRTVLKKQYGMKKLPHSRTIDRILKRAGFVTPRIHKQRVLLPASEVVNPTNCNEIWSTDFKGWWRTQDNERCNPLTIVDGCSRFLIELAALQDLSFELTKARFIIAFKQYGLPSYILSDNGGPFASTQNIWGLTRLSVWWLKLGITPVRIEPGKPYQNGRHERMHLDVARDLQTSPEKNIRVEQKRFEAWRHDFNHIRPHHALEMRSPGEIYKKSTRKFVSVNPIYLYPSNYEVRSVSKSGQFAWGNKDVTFSTAFAGEKIAIEPVNRSSVRIWFTDYFLGTCDRDFISKIIPPPKMERKDNFSFL